MAKKMGRPKIEFTEKEWASIEYMAIIHCTGEEIAAVMHVSYDTLERLVKAKYKISFAEWIKNAAAGGKMSLRRAQWKSAENGNVTMQIFLGKQWLGQTEKIEQTNNLSIEDLKPLSDMLKIDDNNTND